MLAPTNYFIYTAWVILEEIIVPMLDIRVLLILLISEAASRVGVSLTCFI